MVEQVKADAGWLPLTAKAVAGIPASTGVYQIREGGVVVDIGFAGGLTTFGLRGVLAEIATRSAGHEEFRFEVHSQYTSRFLELLLMHKVMTGGLPSRAVERGVAAKGNLDIASSIGACDS